MFENRQADNKNVDVRMSKNTAGLHPAKMVEFGETLTRIHEGMLVNLTLW
jgi:hypothetical protein